MGVKDLIKKMEDMGRNGGDAGDDLAASTSAAATPVPTASASGHTNGTSGNVEAHQQSSQSTAAPQSAKSQPPASQPAAESAAPTEPSAPTPPCATGTLSAGQQAETNGKEEEDPEKKAKKDAKAKAKAAAKAKALAKAEAAKAAAAKPKEGDSKKAKAKKQADDKKAAQDQEVAQLIAAARATPEGQKKDYGGEMLKAYDPKYVEAATYAWWEKCGFFAPDDASDAEQFVIVIPPPNVTGSLHLGHALMVSIEDTLTRWHRMSGRNALWVPGTDHAGIATQTIVEKHLQRERGVTRHDLGRDAFLEEVHAWVRTYGGKILGQLRRMGSSPDWNRLAFTMDANLSAAVVEAFVRLHREGLVYRDNRLVNWDTRLKTAVSDIEVDYIDVPEFAQLKVPGYDAPVEFGVLTSFAYRIEGVDGKESEEEIVVATTRPETMLGDTAVAVHPEDPRYAHLHGRHVLHPLDGRRIPIITDAELVDMSFGTGAVKITPAHDPNDFATGKRHNLASINILTPDGAINDCGGQFAGQPRFKARETVVAWLEQRGLYRGRVGNAMRLGLCSRSKDVIEPVLKPQWWVSCGGMAADACAAVRDGRIEIIPSDFEATWFRWLENIRDWCISRQLWWGHRIPAWYVTLAGETAAPPGSMAERMDRWVVAADAEGARAVAEEKFPGRVQQLAQDEDVLDTWFSSGLFPFSVFGWPRQTPDLAKYYPTTLLETGHDILFFWVARMVMMGMKLTGEVPFRQIYLHSMVRDAHGRKMSKSLGNVIDPLHVIEGISLQGLHDTLLGGNVDEKEVSKAKEGQRTDFPDGIEECGTDALRFALMSYTSQARDVNLDIKRVVAYRHWCNKLWNAVRFALLNLGEGFLPASFSPAPDQASTSAPERQPLACRWILSRLDAATEATVRGLETYAFSAATQALYGWWQYELCDVFIELVKPAVAASESGAAAAKVAYRQTLWLCLDAGLRLLHPFMPFVTEELWQRLPRRPDQATPPSIMRAPYPAADPAWRDARAEADMELALAVVSRARGLRSDYDLLTKQRTPLYILCQEPGRARTLAGAADVISALALSDKVKVLPPGAEAPAGCAVNVVDEATSVALGLKGVLDPAKEIDKLQDKQAKLAEATSALQAKCAMGTYAERTPEAVKASDAEKLAKLQAEAGMLQSHLAAMQAML